MKKIFFFLIITTMLGCKSQKKVQQANTLTAQVFVAVLPQIVIYKTTKAYHHNVPVSLSDDKTQIISYPHPADLTVGGALTLPAQLHEGYLLDNRGIGTNVAFLKFTYEEYSKLKDAPTLNELFTNIIDANPLTELWHCGKKNDFTDIEHQLNEIIDKNQLAIKCRQIK
jgi:hypothetical protein